MKRPRVPMLLLSAGMLCLALIATPAARAAGPADTPPARAALSAEANVGRQRNPFSAPQASPRPGAPAPKDIYFDGSGASVARLPGIRVTGQLSYGGRTRISAQVEGLGPCILAEKDRVVIPGASGAQKSAYFIIKRLRRDSMTIILDDGTTITGKYY